MRKRLVILLTIGILAGYGFFLSRVVVTNEGQRNAFEDTIIIDDTPLASPTTTNTPNPCPSATASQSATAGVTVGATGGSESNINSASSPTATATATSTPCPSATVPIDQTATATKTATAGVTATADTTATIGITPRPMRSPTATATAKTSPTATPTACPKTDPASGVGAFQECQTLAVQLLYRVPERRGDGTDRSPYRIIYDQNRLFTISGIGDNPLVQQLWARFFCGDPNNPNDQVTKEINTKGVAEVSLSEELTSCQKEDVRAKIVGYNDVNDGLPIAGTKADPIHFGDYSYKDARGKVVSYPGFDRSERGVNYLNADGAVAIDTVTAKIWDEKRSPQNILKVVGARPAVGGTFSGSVSGDTWKFCYLPTIPEIEHLTWGNFTCTVAGRNVAEDTSQPKFYLFGDNTGTRPNDTISMGDYVRIHHGTPTGGRDFRITAISSKAVSQQGAEAEWLEFDQFADNTGLDKNGLVPELIGFKRAVSDPNQRSTKGNRRDKETDEVILQVPGITEGRSGHCGRAAVGMVGSWYYSGADNTAWSTPYSQRPAVPVGNGMNLRRLFSNLPSAPADQRVWYRTNPGCDYGGLLSNIVRAFPGSPATWGVIRESELPTTASAWKTVIGNLLKKSIDNGDPVIFYGSHYRRHIFPIIGYKTNQNGTLTFFANDPLPGSVRMKVTEVDHKELTIDSLYANRKPQQGNVLIADRANF